MWVKLVAVYFCLWETALIHHFIRRIFHINFFQENVTLFTNFELKTENENLIKTHFL